MPISRWERAARGGADASNASQVTMDVGEKGCALMESGNGARRMRSNRALVKWGVALVLLAVLVGGSLFVRATILTAHADAYTGCHGVQQATASTSANGYILTVSTIAQYGNGGEWGKGYCGSMK